MARQFRDIGTQSILSAGIRVIQRVYPKLALRQQFNAGSRRLRNRLFPL